MSRVIAIEHVTLDGVMQAPARPDEDTRDGFDLGGWAIPGIDPALQKFIGERMGAAWSLIAGRRTYEDFYSVWPKRAPNPMAEALNRVEKFVASTRLTDPLPWQNSKLLHGDAAEAVAALKKQHNQSFIIFGSGVLLQSLIRRGLIDELILQIHPVVLGKGRRLFQDGLPLTRFRLAASLTTATGVIAASYELAERNH
ncbi:MAG TPA: dihydrofolate reductase family protein [Thermoanaerobaculia bacterium]|nr:dihydrofolate reductase family protein [Thermoanaerobaculia bacterium]